MKKYNEHHIGETHVSKEGYEIKVINGSDKPKHVVVNIDGKYDKTVQYSSLVDGKVKNLYHKSVFGKGYIGIGKHKAYIKGVPTREYIAWRGILQRCYDLRYPIYKDAIVCDEWHNFQVFGEWYDNQHKEEGWQLDKDLLSGNDKVYSPETCVFIPIDLNLFLSRDKGIIVYPVGVYRAGSKYCSQTTCLSSGGRLHLGTFDTLEEADLAYRDNRLTDMLFWLKYIDNHSHVDCRVYERLKVIYEEYKKERDILKKRITNEPSANG